MPIRRLSLTSTQRLAVSKAERRYRRRQAAARTSESRSAAVTGRETEINGILTAEQQAIVTSYHANYKGASAAVAAALDEVLAVNDG